MVYMYFKTLSQKALQIYNELETKTYSVEGMEDKC